MYGTTSPARPPVATTAARSPAVVVEDGPTAVATLSFPVGDRSGVVGETGSGKTTLSKLLCGLYAPDRGVVRFAGVDLREIPEAELRRRVVLVPQEVRMVSGTVAAVGEGVTRVKPGDVVCALVNGGGYAEYCVAWQEVTLPIPAGFGTVCASAGGRLCRPRWK